MKTEYSNAEKVSGNFLKAKYEEILSRLKKYKFLPKSFFSSLAEIMDLEKDNYIILKQLVHLEQEFEEYVRTYFIYDVIPESISFQLSRKIRICEGIHIIDSDPNLFLARNNLTKTFTHVRHSLTENLDSKGKEITCEEFFCKSYGVDDRSFNIKKAMERLTDEDRENFLSKIKQSYAYLWRVIEHEWQENMEPDIKFEKVPDEDVLFISKIFLETFLSDYAFLSKAEDKFAVNFYNLISGIFSLSDREILVKVTSSDFWRPILGFMHFYMEHEKMSESSCTELKVESVMLKKVEDISLIKNKVIFRADLRGLNLSGYDFTGFNITDSDFTGTGANLDFSTINKDDSLCYIRGKRFDGSDLTKCRFKGCKVKNVNFSGIAFLPETFDEECYDESDKFFFGLDVADSLKRKYYARQSVTFEEMGILVEKLGTKRIFERYKANNDSSEGVLTLYKWIWCLKKVFPNSDIFN